MQFKNLNIQGWRQFKDVKIDFHPKVTIITGANGAGKTTILRILSQHYGWGTNFLSTPEISSENGIVRYITGLINSFTGKDESLKNSIGTLQYGNGKIAHITIPDESQVQYNIKIHNKQSVEGLHINSHRPTQSYQQINSIPTNAINAEQAYSSYSNEVMQKFLGSYSQFSPVYRMKESIISMATFGPGNANVQGNPALARLFSEFKRVLSKVLPPTVGFRDIHVRIPDVVLVTETGDFIIDAASGGLMSIIDLSWQIFLFSQNKNNFVVTIDEPENHLHPSMQRSILKRLSDAFPSAQFIVVTHSPFIVSSVRESSVFALKYEKTGQISNGEPSWGKVSSIKLDLDSKAATASEILRDVLGVPVTLPEWAENELMQITKEFSGKPISEENLDELRKKLFNAGLSEYLPDALKIIVS